MTGGALAVGTIAAWVLLMSFTMFRSKRARHVLEGVPSVVVREGRLLEDVLKIERVTHDEIHEAARLQGIADLADVRIALLEPDGKFSFITVDDEHRPAEDQKPKG